MLLDGRIIWDKEGGREGRKTGREGRNGRERKSGVKSSERESER